VTRHRDENTNLLLVRLILLRRHAEINLFASVLYLGVRPFVLGERNRWPAPSANKRMLCDRISPRPSSRTENYARLGVGHGLSMTIATAHYAEELYIIPWQWVLRHEHWSEWSFGQNLEAVISCGDCLKLKFA
jgi:hypothetical protein